MITTSSRSLFLNEHTGLGAFCNHIAKTRIKDPGRPFAVVCERKEDIVVVRSQIFHALNEKHPGLSCSGISTFTLDSLARSLTEWASLALRNFSFEPEKQKLGALSLKQLRSPYLDIVTQEKLVEHVLYNLGYSGSDALPLSKQIITLCDTPLPEDVSLASLILETNPIESSKAAAQRKSKSGSQSLMHLLAGMQAARHLFSGYSRLQSLVTLGFEQSSEMELSELVHSLPPRIAALQCDTLWLEAPTYVLGSNEKSEAKSSEDSAQGLSNELYRYKPGNFSETLVLSLRDVCLRLRHFGETNSESFFLAETRIESEMNRSVAPADNDEAHIQAYLHNGLADLEQHAIPKESDKQEKPFAILGDLKVENRRALDAEASGAYAYSSTDFAHWKEKSQLPSVVQSGLDALWDESRLYDDMLEPHNAFIVGLAKNYGFETLLKNQSERFQLRVRQAQYRAGERSHLQNHPQALSFFATASNPKSVLVLGPPHSPKLPSLNVRTMNQVIHHLADLGVPIEPPASDFMYRCFWSHLTQGSRKVAFHLCDKDELEDLSPYVPNLSELTTELKSESFKRQQSFIHSGQAGANPQIEAFLSEGLYPACDPDWKKHRAEIGKENKPSEHLGVTAFENYVECPLQFYLTHVLHLEHRTQDSLTQDHLETGTLTHSALERFTTFTNLLLHDEMSLAQLEKPAKVFLNG